PSGSAYEVSSRRVPGQPPATACPRCRGRSTVYLPDLYSEITPARSSPPPAARVRSRYCPPTASTRIRGSTSSAAPSRAPVSSTAASAQLTASSASRVAADSPNLPASPLHPDRRCSPASATCAAGRPRRVPASSITSSSSSAAACTSSTAQAAGTTAAAPSPPAARYPQYTNAGRNLFPPSSTNE